jgi:2-(1,2-epoxy-1,2-dihydrophenyl)acetyl-CoA isomerase
MKYENVIVEKENRIAKIILNRPDRLNSFAGKMREEIYLSIKEMGKDENVRVIILTGAGRGFCSGADVEYLAQLNREKNWEGFRGVLIAGEKAVSQIRKIEKPVIAMVNGAAAGGGLNLALACDIRIASEKAVFGQTFIRLGLHPDWSGTYFLPRLVGEAKAYELMLTGDVINADEAFRIGMLNRVVPHEELEKVTMELAEKIASYPPTVVRFIKQAAHQSLHSNLQAMLKFEEDVQMVFFKTEDATEGFSAFLEKRKPEFKG